MYKFQLVLKEFLAHSTAGSSSDAFSDDALPALKLKNSDVVFLFVLADLGNEIKLDGVYLQ